MDRPIQVGDLVYVAKPSPCCHCFDNIGITFVVSIIRTTDDPCECGSHLSDGVLLASDGKSKGGFQVARLKQIPPLEELEATEHQEREPA